MNPPISAERSRPRGTVAESPSTPAPSQPPSAPPRRHRSLFDLDADIFHYICSFVPVDDVLFHLTNVCRDARRRLWGNNELWQQLWMRYLVQFFKSLIPPAKLTNAATSAAAVAATSSSSSPVLCTSPWPAGAVDTTATTMVGATCACSDAAWRLYHYHASKEARPRVELLERLRVTPEDISDPPAEETPQKAVSSFVGLSAGMRRGVDKAQEQTLLFAQLCATQLVTNNLTHTETPPPASRMLSAQGSPKPAAADVPPSARPPDKKSKKAAAAARRRERQAERLRRALHFLLSASGHRPAFQDRLWSSTYEAGEAYQREVLKGAGDASSANRRHKKSTKVNALVEKDRLRPLSWLDDRDTSVKVLFFEDNSRSVGDAGSVQAERIKLLAAIAHHWRLAYAHQFYLTPTDGKDHGSAQPHPSPLLRGHVSRDNDEYGAATAARLRDGRASWEQVYRRFRDDSANVHSARIHESLRRVGMGDASSADGAPPTSPTSSARVHVIPSSGNPLFDMHLLTYSKRKQFYAAMLTSTVEVPDGMGVFVATCVSESFLRWWCWRSRRLREIAAAETTPVDHHRANPIPPPSATITLPTIPSAYHGAVPATTTLWIARVCSVHKPQYGTTASDGSFGRPAPIEAEESFVYSSSYSDVTSTDTLASDSASIDFVEEVPEAEAEVDESAGPGVAAERGEEEEEDVDAFQSYPDNGMDGSSGSIQPQRTQQQQWQQQQSPSSTRSRASAPRVALLFPLPHLLAYWFMMHHVTFYSHQVYRRMWGDHEITIAVCSRILSPTGHSVECRLFYTLRCAAFPRMYTKMMFTPGTLPVLTIQDKMSARSPYRSPSTTSASLSSSARSSSSSSSEGLRPPSRVHARNVRRNSDSDSSADPSPSGHPPARPPPPSASRDASSTTSSSSSAAPRQRRHPTLDEKPVDSRQVYDLFWTGFGRVEVESGPTISRANLVRLRVALGLTVDFPMGLLWNVLMFASGVGPLILKEHRHSLYFAHPKSFTDILEEEFGEASCYGYGARPVMPTAGGGGVMPNPLDAVVELMREQHHLDEDARALVEGLAEVENASSRHAERNSSGGVVDVSFSTAEGADSSEQDDDARRERNAVPPTEPTTSSLSTSSTMTTHGSWGLDSEFSSMGGRSS
ncbi:hypothetical protein ABB37_08812 [Leptomonas pyrrhocoris]|uniref:Uncharacterized protein n=1 Tax=Leptomonas pyrrhocoris TaxID=157538 RepID=A0A0M9FSF8_LEPPY|nr:hypothetical protein ABB37_08812 [Leptomonas pyrrhocoris]KPA75150.1 hypothetical protein ABB37_08812 [Leptomonas pyrrhocoris]|eukprot:XP_015653589.1 hypothetical protein ABB37_08812 [Leptomonas pyrrhocoris]